MDSQTYVPFTRALCESTVNDKLPLGSETFTSCFGTVQWAWPPLARAQSSSRTYSPPKSEARSSRPDERGSATAHRLNQTKPTLKANFMRAQSANGARVNSRQKNP